MKITQEQYNLGCAVVKNEIGSTRCFLDVILDVMGIEVEEELKVGDNIIFTPTKTGATVVAKYLNDNRTPMLVLYIPWNGQYCMLREEDCVKNDF